MAVVANGDKICDQTIFSVPVNMVDNNNSMIKISAVITFFLIHFPGVSQVASRFLGFKRFSMPMSILTHLATIFLSSEEFVVRNRNYFLAFFARHIRVLFLFLSNSNNMRTFSRAMILWFCRALFRNKFNSTFLADIYHPRLLTVYSPTFVATSCVPILMGMINFKVIRANRAYFCNFLHRRIIT